LATLKDPKTLKILAMDIGSKRIGLAIWNPAAKLSRPIDARKRKTLKEDIAYLKQIVIENEIEAFLIGIPLSLGGKITESTKNAHFWVEQMKTFSLPVFTFDESFSTQDAFAIMQETTARKKHKEKKDSIAAALFLEEFIRETA
jgi:putative Holliday junction resolvase